MKKNIQNYIQSTTFCFLVLFITSIFAATVSMNSIAAPEAGSVIGNQASATYTDSSGAEYSTTSNLVETIIQPVYGVSLVDDRTHFSTPGGTVYFPHTLTNAGNASDTFNLVAANSTGDSFDLSNLAVYLDADRDGSPDSSEPITSISLNMDAEVSLIVVGTVPSLNTAAESANVTLTATSDSDTGQTTLVTDTVTIRAGAVMQVTKSMSATTGSSGGLTEYTVTLAYQNTGNAAAEDLEIIDTLPTGMAYVAGSGKASIGGTDLSDASDIESATNNGSVITYEYANGIVTFTVDSVSNSGYVEFNVTIADNTAAGSLVNTASFSYGPDGDKVAGSTNSVTFTVSPERSFTLIAGDGDVDGDDVQKIDSASEGSIVTFSHSLTNTGNLSEILNLTLDGSTYPAGTVFKLFRSDGVTPLVDTNGDGVLNVGLLESGDAIDVVLKAYLPPGATGGPFDVVLTAQSAEDNNIVDSVTDTLTTIASLTVDIAIGSVDTADPLTSEAVLPSETVMIPLSINNSSDSNDTYDVSVPNLPAGWEVEFFIDFDGNGKLDPGEPTFTNSGSIPSGEDLDILAVITVPGGESPSTTDLTFTVDSPNSSATSTVSYEVIVDSVYAFSLSPDNTAQGAPGTSVTLAHTLKNTGNAATGDITLAVEHSNSQGWNATIYLDDGSIAGELDSGDSVYDASPPPNLAVDEQITLFVQAIIPLSATATAQDAITVSASITPVADTLTETVTDVITVITTEIRLTKLQALDSDCNGVIDAAGFSAGEISTGAVPGACLVYRITANNDGSDTVTSLVIYDSTPAFTTLESTMFVPKVIKSGTEYTLAGDCLTTTPTLGVNAPADEVSGMIEGHICNLAPGETGYVEFSVEIDL